jgi:hypothetical protein
VDLFGRERARLRREIAELKAKQAQTSQRAGEGQAKIHELERIIEDLRAEVARRKSRGAPAREVSEAETALRDAQAIHSESTR